MVPPDCNNGALSCPAHFEPLPLAEARARFQREAVRGVCDTGRYRCPYFVWGRGPALVCIPGLVDDAEAFLRPLALLSRHFRCVAYDWPGGRGDCAHWPTYRHRDLVADLMVLLDHLQIEKAVVMGYSFGSTVALAALHAHPSRLPRGVLLSGFAHRTLAPAEQMLSVLGRWLPGTMAQLPLRSRVLKATQHWGFAQTDPAVWDYYLQRTGQFSLASVAYRACLLHQVDLRQLLPRIHQPVLLLCGDADPLVNKKCEMELLTGLNQVVRVELPHCGHYALYTHPELIAETIVRFCDSPPWESSLAEFLTADSAEDAKKKW
jgi:3-oxoadipate enol-lactonase